MSLFGTFRRAFATLLLVIVGAVRSVILLVCIALLVLLKGRRALTPRLRDEEPECLQDPSLGGHDFFTMDDVTLHYVSAGSMEKPVVLLLHGFPDIWFCWKHQILGLKNDFRVVALDLRGYGRSSKSDRVVDYRGSRLVEDVHQLIISLGNKKVNIVAHDWGAVIAWWLATKYENLVERMVIINGPHPLAMKYQLEHSLSQICQSWYFVAFQLPWLPETVFSMNDMKLFDKLHAAYNDEEREAIKYTFSKPGALTGPINYYRASFRLQSDDPPPYRPLAIPTLFVWGCHDVALTKDIAELSRQYASSSRVEYVPDAGHWVHRERPKLVNDYIRKFLHIDEGTISRTGTALFSSTSSPKGGK